MIQEISMAQLFCKLQPPCWGHLFQRLALGPGRAHSGNQGTVSWCQGCQWRFHAGGLTKARWRWRAENRWQPRGGPCGAVEGGRRCRSYMQMKYFLSYLGYLFCQTIFKNVQKLLAIMQHTVQLDLPFQCGRTVSSILHPLPSCKYVL